MAYVSAVNDGQVAGDVLSVECLLPPHVSGDVLVIAGFKDDATGGNHTIGTATGWINIAHFNNGASGSSSGRGSAWYKVATSSSEVNPVITSTDADAWCWAAFVVKDVDTANVLSGSAVTGSVSAYPYNASQVTTVTDNALVISVMGGDAASAFTAFPGYSTISSADAATVGLGVAYFVQPTAGATGTIPWYGTSQADRCAWCTFALRNATGGKVPGSVNPAKLNLIAPLYGISACMPGQAASGNANDFLLFGRQFNPTHVFRDDGGVFTDLTAAATDDTDADVAFRATEAVNDAIYIGYTSPFDALRVDRAGCTAGVAGVLSYQYWNGASWQTAPNVYNPTTHFITTGTDFNLLSWTMPTNWQQNSVNGVTRYWFRMRITTLYTTNPTISRIYVGDGGSLLFDALGSTADTAINPLQSGLQSSPATNSTQIFQGSTFIIRNADVSVTGQVVVGSYIYANPRHAENSGLVEYGGVPFALIDAANNGHVWTVGGFKATDAPPDKRIYFAIQPDQLTNTKWTQGVGVNLAQIRKVLIAPCTIAGATTVYWNQLVGVQELQFSGGTSGIPLTWDDVRTAANSYSLRMEFIEGTTCVVPLKFGGHQPIFVDASNFALEWPRQADRSAGARRCKFHVDDDVCGVSIDGRAGDVIKLRSCIIKGNNRIKFTVEPTALATATYDFDGLTLINALATLRPIYTFSGINFVDSTVNLNTAVVDDCFFTNTVVNADLANVGNISNCGFVGDNTGHGLVITGSASTINFTGNSFAGFASTNGSTGNEAIYVNIATGTVTINLLGAATVPSIRTAGATVNVVSSKQVTLTGLVAGSEVRAYSGTDPATSVELAGTENLVGTTFNFSHSLDGVQGYIVVLSLQYLPVWLDITYSQAGDVTIPIQQRVERNYLNP